LPGLDTPSPEPGHIFPVLNITLKNNDVKSGLKFTNKSTDLLDLESGEFVGRSLNSDLDIQKDLENPLILPIKIKQHDMITGQILFTATNSNKYRLDLVDHNNKILLSQNIDVT
jgi:nitrogen fixation protein